ncbi:MAG: cadherin-like beta sandwich domain-containing protein, partial [Anaeroplasmataceae bacterium]|nr:cadherin-like beta sandwich domain-containing protein [Anaeroplasmataceae bacterium]
MKITRKIKIGLSLFLMSFIILFTFRSFKANAAATTGTITYHYSIYAKSTWDAYQAAVNNENFIVGEDLKVSGQWDVDTIIEALEDYEANAPYEDWIDDWGIPIPFYVSTDLAKSGGDYSTTGKGTNMKYVASGSSHSGNSAEVYAYLRQLFPSKNLNDATTYPQITQVVPGDEIFVGVTAEYTGGTNFNSAVVLLDLQKYAQGGTVQKHANTPQGWTESNQTATNIGITLGGTNTGGSAQASPFFLGGYSFTVATGLSGNMQIEFNKSSTYGAYNSFSSGQSGMTAITYKTVPASFKEDNCVLTVSGLSDNVDLTNITVEGQSCLSTATNVTVKGESTKQYKGAEVSDGTANVVVTVADSGKLDPSSVKYGSTIAAATQNPLNSSTSGFDVNMSALSPGQSYIAIFKVISSSTLVEKWYAVELIKAKDSNCDLNNLGVSATGSPDIRWNTPFTSATTSYEVYIPKGTTGLNFTPVVDSNLKTITAAYPATATAQAVTSGTAYAVNNWTNNSQVKFTVTAQSGVTKDYTVTLKEVDLKPTSVTATSGSAFNASDTDADNDSHFTIDNLPFKSNQFTLRAVFPNPSIISKVELYQGNVLSTQTVLNNQGATFNITNSSTKTALTETIRMVVTSTSGNSQTFYIDVNRLAANSNADLGTVSIVANNGSNTTICNSFTDPNLNITYPSGTELPLAYKNFTVTATPSNALSTVEISIEGNKTSTYTFSGAAAVTATVSIKVIAEDGTTKTYTGQVKRAGANDDQTFTIIDTTYTYQDAGGSTLNGTYTLPQAPTNNAIKNADNLLPYLAKTATFTIKPNTATTKVFIDGVDYTNRPFSLTFSNTPTQHYRSFQVLIKSEYDEVIRPSTTQTGKTSGGLAFTLEVWCEDPDDTRVLTDVKLLHASSSVEISNATNTSIAGNTYSYTLKESQVGSSFKLNLAWNSATTEAFVSTTNAASIMTASNKYSPDKTWSIGTKVYVYLKSQSGNHTVYIIDTQFADERSTENGIQNVEFFTDATKTNKLSIVFNETQTTYPSTATLSVPYSLEEVVAVVTVKHSKETLAAGNKYISAGVDTSLQATQTIKLSQGLNTLYVQGVAENGQQGTRYVFNIEREAGGTENYMETLNINGVDCADSSKIGTNFDYAYVKTKTTFSFYVPRGTGYVNVNFGVSSKASYTISSEAGTSSSLPYGCSITDGSMITLTINVKSEVETVTKTGNGRTYTIKIYCADVENKLDDLSLYVSDTDFTDILDINDNRFTFNKDQINLGTFTVPFKVKIIFFMTDKPGFNGTVKFGSSILTNLSDGYSMALSTPTTYSVKITVTPELANLASGDSNIKQDKTITYSLNVVRQKGSNNAYLQTLEIYIDGTLRQFTINDAPQAFNKTITGPYMVEHVSTAASAATIIAVPEDDKATVTGDNDQPLAVSLSGSTSQIFRVKVTAEDEVTTKEYLIQIWTTKANPSTDKELNKITATSNTNATKALLSPTYNQKITQYTVGLGSTEDEAILHFTKKSSDSTLHIVGDLDDVTTTEISYDYTIPVAPGATVVYTVYVTAQDGSKGEDYEITISRAPADTNATLKEFTINGQPVTGFNAGDNGGQYKVFIKDAATVYFDGVPTNETTTISDNPAPSSDRQPLNIGSNIFTVVTTAQDGKTTCKYRVDVVRDAPKVIEDLFAYVGSEQRLLPSPFTPTLYTGYTVKLGFDETSVVMSYVSQYVDSKDNTVSVIAPDGSEITSATNNITVNNIPV